MPYIEQIEESIKGLSVIPDELETAPKRSWEELASNMTAALQIEGVSSWTLGDLAFEVAHTFGTKKDPGTGKTPMELMASDLNMKPGTLKHYAWVSSAFPNKEARKQGLTWSHYRLCASKDNTNDLIALCIENNWTVVQLEQYIKNEEDDGYVETGVCSHCQGSMSINDARHVRAHGRREGSFCTTACIVGYYLKVLDEEQALERLGVPEEPVNV